MEELLTGKPSVLPELRASEGACAHVCECLSACHLKQDLHYSCCRLGTPGLRQKTFNKKEVLIEPARTAGDRSGQRGYTEKRNYQMQSVYTGKETEARLKNSQQGSSNPSAVLRQASRQSHHIGTKTKACWQEVVGTGHTSQWYQRRRISKTALVVSWWNVLAGPVSESLPQPSKKTPSCSSQKICYSKWLKLKEKMTGINQQDEN